MTEERTTSRLLIKDRDFIHKITYESSASPFKLHSSLFQVESSEIDISSDANQISKSSLPSYLKANKIIIIDSVASGHGRDPNSDLYEECFSPILKILNLEPNHEYWPTKTSESIKDFAKKILTYKDEEITLFFISGDTSVHDFVNHINGIEKEIKLNIGIIPMGTGNAFALELGLINPIEAILKLFTNSTTQEFPIYKATFSKGSHYRFGDLQFPQEILFFVVLSWGLHAAIVGDSDVPELRQFGNQRFQMSAANNIQNVAQKYYGEIYLNGEKLFDEETHGYVLLGLVKSLEKGFCISPKSDILHNKVYLLDIPKPVKEEAVSEEDFDSSTVTGSTTDTEETADTTKVSSLATSADSIASENDYLIQLLTKVYNNSSHVDDPRVKYVPVLKSIGDVLEIRLKNEPNLSKRRVCVDGRMVVVDGDEKWVKIWKEKGKVLGDKFDLRLIVPNR